MKIFSKIFNQTIGKVHYLLNKSNFIHIDSQKDFTQKQLDNLTSEDVISEIKRIESSDGIYNSFLHNTYIKEILSYTSRQIMFVNCTFDLDVNTIYDYHCVERHKFINCKIYVRGHSDVVEYNPQSHIDSGAEWIFTNYITTLFKRDNKKQNYNMLSLDNLNLEDISLPNNPNLFLNLERRVISNSTFSNIDFSKYNTSNIKFKNCTFKENTILSDDMLNGNLKFCCLPPIKFSSNSTYNIENCTIHKDSLFPDDEDFFLKSTFKACVLPETDYSKYRITKDSFKECTFHEKAVLPYLFYDEKNKETLYKIKKIPARSLTHILRYWSCSEEKAEQLKKDINTDIKSLESLYIQKCITESLNR